MPYARPALTDLINQAVQDVIDAQITDPQTSVLLSGLLNQAVLRVMAKVMAGLVYGEYGYIDWLSLMAVPWTAENEFLEGWAALKDIFRKDATSAGGTFGIASGATNGTVLLSGTIVTRSDGTAYATTEEATVSGGALSVPILASIPAAAGNAPSGITLTLSSTVVGIPTVGTATTALTGGSDQELDADLRTRMLEAYAAPPQGGDKADYVQWAEAVPGVTRAWVSPNGNGPGTVVIFTMFDDAESAFGGFPQGTNGVSQFDEGPGGTPRAAVATGDQLTVADSICLKQPVTALVTSAAPANAPVNFTIANLGAANTAANQAAIEAALSDMFLRLGYVGGTSDPITGEAWATIDPSDWYAAIGSVPGIGRFTVPTPSAPITPASGALNTLGTCTFSS